MSEADIERIADLAAERAVEKALQRMYVEIGREFLKKAAYVIGVAIIALGIWLANRGYK